MTLYVCIGENSESGKEKIIIIQLSDPNLKDFSIFFLFMAHWVELEPNVFFFCIS